MRVYVISDGTAYKIGIAKNPYKRMKSIQCGNPREVFLVLSIPGDYKLERWLHCLFDEKHVRGEWYNLSDEDVLYIKNGKYGQYTDELKTPNKSAELSKNTKKAMARREKWSKYRSLVGKIAVFVEAGYSWEDITYQIRRQSNRIFTQSDLQKIWVTYNQDWYNGKF